MKYKPLPVGSIRGNLRGQLDYYLKPKLKRNEGGPFNGQEFRQGIFLELVRNMGFSAIVETGTFRGLTTQYMYRNSGLPVYTAELSPRFLAYARLRLRKDTRVTLYNSDSRAFLQQLINGRLLENDDVFFYLDAHWGEDLPLLEEIEIIFGNLPGAVVMVDDFKVPWDTQYTYDDYGNGKTLDLDYLAPAIDKYGLVAFFPAQDAAGETGARRGCVVLAGSPEKISLLKEQVTLKICVNRA
jgi:predicted O-methyltransferase YrrM